MKKVRLKVLLDESQPGFACGVQDPAGIFQFRMHNVSKESSISLETRRRVPRDAHKSIDKFLLRPGDVLFNSTNSPDGVGKSVLVPRLDEPAVFSNHFLRLRSKDQLLCSAYLWRWLQFQFGRGIFQGMCRQWVNQATVSREDLLELEIPLVSLDEQQRVAAILDHADTLRAKRRQVLAHLDALASALFAEFFSNVRELDTFRRTGVGFIAGKNVVGDGFDSHPTNKVIKVSAISTGRFVQDESKPMPSSYSPPESHRLRKGDVLFGRASGSLDLLGETAVVDHEVDDLFLPDKVWRLSVDPSSPLSPKYVLGLLRSPRIRAFIRHNASGAAGVRNISKSKLLEMTVPVPSREVQSRYASLVESVEAQRAVVQQQSDLDNELFTALQSRAFRGEL